MKNAAKGYVMGFLSAILLIALATAAYAAARHESLEVFFNNIRIVVNGELITPRDGLGNVVEPFIVDGTTFLPVRAVADALGQTVEWDGATQTVYIGPRPGSVQFLTDAVRAHQTSLGNERLTPTSRFYEFSALRSGGTEGFNMGGERFVDGMRFQNGGVWAAFNLNSRFTNLSGVAGQIDGTNFEGLAGVDSVVRFLVDGRLAQEIVITDGMLPQPFSIDLTGVNQLRIETASDGWLNSFIAGVGNPVIR